MKIQIRLLASLIVTVVIVACNPKTEDQTDQHQSNKTNPSLTLQQLQNAKYRIRSDDDTFQLIDGEYRKKYEPDSASERILRLSHSAAGNLDDTGGEDAVVILIDNPGGSGTFYYLFAFINQNGKPFNVATILLGDRVRVEGLAIKEKEIIVDMLTRGDDEAMASEPTLEITRKYRLEANRLALVEE